MLQNLLLIHCDLLVGSAICYKIKEPSQKLTPLLFQNDLVYILNLIGNEKMRLTSVFGASS